jgi:hypothetical protein
MSEPTRPTVAEVARLIRARTKDSEGREVGTFTDDTRPSAEQVDEHIDSALALLSTRFPAGVAESYQPAVRALVAYRAALQIEKSYFPEQVRSDRSAYTQLREEYFDDLNALLDAVAEGGDGGVPGRETGAHSEWTPTFLAVYGLAGGFPPGGPWGAVGADYFPEPENPENWRQPLQPPREPPAPEDIPVGEAPARATWERDK